MVKDIDEPPMWLEGSGLVPIAPFLVVVAAVIIVMMLHLYLGWF